MAWLELCHLVREAGISILLSLFAPLGKSHVGLFALSELMVLGVVCAVLTDWALRVRLDLSSVHTPEKLLFPLLLSCFHASFGKLQSKLTDTKASLVETHAVSGQHAEHRPKARPTTKRVYHSRRASILRSRPEQPLGRRSKKLQGCIRESATPLGGMWSSGVRLSS